MKNLNSIKVIILTTIFLCCPLSYAVKRSMSDAAITEKVKDIYVQKKIFDDERLAVIGIGVKTIDGIVYLTGTVENKTEINTAIKYAKSVYGVKKVESKLRVNP